MNKHVIAESLLVAVILIGAAWYFHQQSLDAAKIQAKVEGRAEQQKKDDETLQQVQAAKAESDAKFIQSQKKLQEMSSREVVQQAPQFVAGIPASSRPIVIWQPGVTPPQEGDAIIPADQIKPIAAQILAGNNCMVNDLPSCVKERDIWSHKFTLRDQDAKDWEKMAKGGGFGRKFKRCGIIGASNFGLGYGVTPSPLPGQNDVRMRNGIILGAGNMGLCWFLH